MLTSFQSYLERTAQMRCQRNCSLYQPLAPDLSRCPSTCIVAAVSLSSAVWMQRSTLPATTSSSSLALEATSASSVGAKTGSEICLVSSKHNERISVPPLTCIECSTSGRHGIQVWQIQSTHSNIHRPRTGELRNPPNQQPLLTALEPYHNDVCDILCMYIQDCATNGGESILASSATVYNHIAATRPDMVRTLAAPIWIYDK